MSSGIIFERYLWFQNEVKKNRHPNAKTLAERFEISVKTAQRNIDFIRDRLGMPIEYVAAMRGYVCPEPTWELPGVWLTEDELISLVLSYRLASAVPDAALKTSLRTFLNDVIARHATAKYDIDQLAEKISVKNVAYARTSDLVFHRVLEALLKGSPVRIEYYSPHQNRLSERDILPLHLLSYMGTWHIVAFCQVKNELRDFVLSRVRSISSSDATIVVNSSAAGVKDYIRRTFGIFHGKETKKVSLRFAKEIAPWIAEQHWHRDQDAFIDGEGSLCLTVPVADFREIKREILRYGAQVEVVSPKALRDDVKKEIEKMRKVYR
jgi:predicted DNA-binding transcriptional regulator YafY